MDDAAEFKRVRRRLLRNLKQVEKRCAQLIADAESWMQNGKVARPFDLEDTRLRLAGARRAIACIHANRPIDKIAQRMLYAQPNGEE